MKIAICASEVVPFAKTGGLADVAGALPLALESLVDEVIIVMPGYKTVFSRGFNIQRLKKDISYCVISKKVKVYFIEKDSYFNRDGLYGDKRGDYKDNLERFSYYCARALDLFKETGFCPDVIHAHDWQAALIPVYLKTLRRDEAFYKKTRTLFTIHNIGYQGLFPKEEFPKSGLGWDLFNPQALEFYGKINILKGGLVFSDVINTVSPTYSSQIQTQEFGFGLQGVLAERKGDLFGILNGLDYSIWDPRTDKFITRNYSAGNIRDKYSNKEQLQKECGFPEGKETPLLGIVSRIVEPKGFDILTAGIDAICKKDLQLVILGTGELKYHEILRSIASRYPRKVSVNFGFNDPLAHKIYAGCDIFLMPSRYEPCGLGQMVSLRYGTVPVVFKTGGLADTVTSKNGFVFDKYSAEELTRTIGKAMRVFRDQEKWATVMDVGMRCNFSWEESASKYVRLYEKAKAKK